VEASTPVFMLCDDEAMHGRGGGGISHSINHYRYRLNTLIMPKTYRAMLSENSFALRTKGSPTMYNTEW